MLTANCQLLTALDNLFVALYLSSPTLATREAGVVYNEEHSLRWGHNDQHRKTYHRLSA
jgi:hypothetical protein